MDEEDIRRLKAGPEMDDLVAEKVLGQCIHRQGWRQVVPPPAGGPWWDAPGDPSLYTCAAGCGAGWYRPIGVNACLDFGRPEYSMDLGRAGVVIHSMVERGYRCTIEVDATVGVEFLRQDASAPHLARFVKHGCSWAVAPTAALAVCRAALLAVWPNPGRSRANPWWGPRRTPTGGGPTDDELFAAQVETWTTLPGPPAMGVRLAIAPGTEVNFWNFCPWCYEAWPCPGKCHLKVADPSKVTEVGGLLLVSPGAYIVERKG